MNRKITFPRAEHGTRRNAETNVEIVTVRYSENETAGFEVRKPTLTGHVLVRTCGSLPEARVLATEAVWALRGDVAEAYDEARADDAAYAQNRAWLDENRWTHGAIIDVHDEALRIDRDRVYGYFAMQESRSDLSGPQHRWYGRQLRRIPRTWDIATDHRAVIEALHAEALAENDERDAFWQNRAWVERHDLPSGRREHVRLAIDRDHAEALAAGCPGHGPSEREIYYCDGRCQRPIRPTPARPLSAAVAARTRIPEHGTTTLDVMPPKPCGLNDCVGELWIRVGNDGPTRVHLNEAQRSALITALGGAVRTQLGDAIEAARSTQKDWPTGAQNGDHGVRTEGGKRQFCCHCKGSVTDYRSFPFGAGRVHVCDRCWPESAWNTDKTPKSHYGAPAPEHMIERFRTVMSDVVDGWVDGGRENHEALGHRGEMRPCWEIFGPDDIRRMVDDACREIASTDNMPKSHYDVPCGLHGARGCAPECEGRGGTMPGVQAGTQNPDYGAPECECPGKVFHAGGCPVVAQRMGAPTGHAAAHDALCACGNALTCKVGR